MCKYGEGSEPDLPQMIAIVSDNVRKWEDKYGGQTWSLKSGVSGAEIVSKLKEVTTCPACILAAIRLSGVPGPFFYEFNYKKESAEFWGDYNDAKADEEYRRY